MAWRKPTLADIEAVVSVDELDAYRQSSSFGGADPVEALLATTAEMVRGYCRANRTVAVSPTAGEIPEGLIAPAMDYAAFDILKRQPVPIGQDRRDARSQAIDLFARVAKGEVSPESHGGGGAAIEPIVSVPERILD
jgi:hypothetical protein